MNTTVSCLVELQEPLHDQVARFLEEHPNWDCDRVFNTALSLFLLQNHSNLMEARRSARIYIEGMFSLTRTQKMGTDQPPDQCPANELNLRNNPTSPL